MEELEYDYRGVERTSYEYTWADGVKVRTSSSGAREEYRYDGAGRLVRTDRYGSDGASDGYEELTYDEDGDLIRQTDYTASRIRYTTTEEFIYERP